MTIEGINSRYKEQLMQIRVERSLMCWRFRKKVTVAGIPWMQRKTG